MSLSRANKFHPQNPKNQGKDLRENFCRNPDGDKRGPWCFVASQPMKFQYCLIPSCQYTTFVWGLYGNRIILFGLKTPN